MVNLLSSKKAQNADSIIVPIIFVFALALIFIFSAIIGTQVIDGFRTVYSTNPGLAPYNTAQAQKVMDDFEKPYHILDQILMAFVIGLIIGIGYTSYRLSAIPAFYVVTIVLGIIYCFFGYIFSYIFIQFISNPSLLSITKLFPLTIMICTNLHWLGLGLIVVGAITLYGKKPTDTIPLR